MGALAVRTRGETFLLFKRSNYVSDSVVLVMGREEGEILFIGLGLGLGLGWELE